ncbi:hypothetical protein ES703_39098 [subsurface metagenome]
MNTASKNVVDMYGELQELDFPVRWTIPNRSFIVEGGTLRYTGLRFGRKTYLTKRLLFALKYSILNKERLVQIILNTPVTKLRTRKTHEERKAALEMFLSDAPKYGLTDAWLVGGMAEGKDHPLSDVDLCVAGKFSLEQLYSLRDEVYLRTGVIIHLITDPPKPPKVKVYGS